MIWGYFWPGLGTLHCIGVPSLAIILDMRSTATWCDVGRGLTGELRVAFISSATVNAPCMHRSAWSATSVSLSVSVRAMLSGAWTCSCLDAALCSAPASCACAPALPARQGVAVDLHELAEVGDDVVPVLVVLVVGHTWCCFPPSAYGRRGAGGTSSLDKASPHPALSRNGCTRAAGYTPAHALLRWASGGRFVGVDDVAQPPRHHPQGHQQAHADARFPRRVRRRRRPVVPLWVAPRVAHVVPTCCGVTGDSGGRWRRRRRTATNRLATRPPPA